MRSGNAGETHDRQRHAPSPFLALTGTMGVLPPHSSNPNLGPLNLTPKPNPKPLHPRTFSLFGVTGTMGVLPPHFSNPNLGPLNLTLNPYTHAPSPFLALTGTMGVWPPHSSGTRLSSSRPCLVRSTSAPGLSILLMATTMGTSAAW